MNAKNKLLLHSLLFLVVIILINGFAQRQRFQFDLTQEKRYTLTNETKELLQQLEEPIDIFVFLKDEHLPADLKRLQNATRDILQQYKAVNSRAIRIHFENPLKGLSAEERNQTMLELQQRGLTPTNVRIKTKNGYSEHLIFPGALVNYRDKQFPVMLLSGQKGRNAINESIELLEYKLSNAINKLQLEQLPTVAFLQGNGELTANQTRRFRELLATNYYRSTLLNIQEIDTIPQTVNLLVIAQPKQTWSKATKFKVDQYIMNGGKTLWALDVMKMNLDSLRTVWQGKNVAVDYPLDIDDQLFTYGVRLKRNLIRDLQSTPIPVVIDETGQTELFPWSFFPVVSGKGEHFITENVKPVRFQFASEIELLNLPNVEQTVLLQSSEKAGVVANPVFIDLNELRNPPPTSAFSLSNLPMAVLLQGEFKSLFQHRATPMINYEASRKNRSSFTKMAVISDGDILSSEILPNGQTLPIGFDRHIGEQFGNEEFLLNLVDFLVLEQPQLAARNKQVQMRLLNQTKVEEQKSKWQFLNFTIPIGVLLLLWLSFYWYRKQRFT